MTIILASKSPRRQQLLARITSDFVVIPSHAEELSEGSPSEQVLGSARAKADAVGAEHDGLVLGVDTLVALNDRVMGKPSSRSEAAEMLRALSGKQHLVLSGVHLWDTLAGTRRQLCVETQVRFRLIADEELEWYLDSGEYSDKAGAYGIQGRAAVFIEGITGEYTNVMGLPLCELGVVLRELGVGL